MTEEKKTNNGEIDTEVLLAMKSENVELAVSDDKQIKRVILNCFCEFLSEIKELNKQIDDFNTFVSVVSSDKVVDFFMNIQDNTKEEVKRVELFEKAKKSHLKPKKKK